MSEELIVAPISFLDLIKEVATTPELSTDRMKALLDMQLLLEDRVSEKAFNAAMIKAQKEIQALKWDKKGDNNNLYVRYPTIEKMLKPVREANGFVQTYDTESGATPDQMVFCCDVSHTGGHTRRYRLPMSIDGSGPKGGGVMSKAQAVGNGTSYAMRYLDKMIWNIPMLVDKDDNDGAAPVERISEKQAADLNAMLDELGGDKARHIATFCKYFGVETMTDLRADFYTRAVAAIDKKRRAA